MNPDMFDLNNTWRIFDNEYVLVDETLPLCYCKDEDSAYLILENLSFGDDCVIVPPGKTLQDVLSE